MNVFFGSFRIALRALFANKLRSSLTMLGMIIGVGAVIAMLSIGQGAQTYITSQIESLGTNLLFIYPGNQRLSGHTAAGMFPTLTYEDGQALGAALVGSGDVLRVIPESQDRAQAVYEGQNMNVRIDGTTPEYPYMRNWTVKDGEFFSQSHVDSAAPVAVLGANLPNTLLGGEDPIGATIRLNRIGFRVIGVMEPKGGSAMGNQDDQVFIPITTLLTRMNAQRTARGSRNVSLINVQLGSTASTAIVTDEINSLLRERHRLTGDDDFTILSQKDILSLAGQITGVLTILLGSIAGISLVVGGIGIMNIMLVSVTERTREIGIRKAVGAKRRDILMQFLVEAMTVSVLGGAMGIGVGALLARVVSGIDLGGTKLTTEITPDAVILAFGVSAAIGLFFGIYPAFRAASLHPIDALRYE